VGLMIFSIQYPGNGENMKCDNLHGVYVGAFIQTLNHYMGSLSFKLCRSNQVIYTQDPVDPNVQ
jgi:hypothetical protein